MCSCDQSLVTLAFLWEKLSQPQFYKDLTRKTAFFEGWSWFKFNNLRLALGTKLKFYTNVTKGLKSKVRKFWWLIPTFVEVTGEKLVGGPFRPPHLWHKCFPVNFEKFVRTPFLQNTSGRLLLKMDFSLIINLLIMELHVSSIMTLYSVPEA